MSALSIHSKLETKAGVRSGSVCCLGRMESRPSGPRAIHENIDFGHGIRTSRDLACLAHPERVPITK